MLSVHLLMLLAIVIVISMQRQALATAAAARRQLTLAYTQQSRLRTLKNDLLIHIGHELLTPLTEIQGYLELLQDHQTQLDEGTYRAFAAKALRGSEELQILTANMLAAAEAGQRRKQLRREILAARPLIVEVLERIPLQIKQSFTVECAISDALSICAEPIWIRQVLYNLLINAFKYSPVGSKVTVSARISEMTTNLSYAPALAEVSIKDAGYGIPPEEQSLLFAPFVRLKRDISGHVRGSGLGLYICKQLIEGMGGVSR